MAVICFECYFECTRSNLGILLAIFELFLSLALSVDGSGFSLASCKKRGSRIIQYWNWTRQVENSFWRWLLIISFLPIDMMNPIVFEHTQLCATSFMDRSIGDAPLWHFPNRRDRFAVVSVATNAERVRAREKKSNAEKEREKELCEGGGGEGGERGERASGASSSERKFQRRNTWSSPT